MYDITRTQYSGLCAPPGVFDGGLKGKRRRIGCYMVLYGCYMRYVERSRSGYSMFNLFSLVFSRNNIFSHDNSVRIVFSSYF